MFRIGLLILLGVSLSLPAFLGDPFVAHDLLFHLNWIKLFSEQFWNGDLYPRWLAGMNGGLGSPVFFFYGPVPFFISSLFAPFLENDPHGWLQLGLSFSLALVLSGICGYLWIRKIADPWSAFLAAALYMVLPYHLMIDLYSRLSLAEFWTFVWMPLVLYSTSEIVSQNKYGILKFSFSYSLLIMTHLPAALIFSIIPLTYGLTFSETGRRHTNACCIVAAMCIGVGLSAIYLAPAILAQKNIITWLMYLGSWKYDQNFLKADFRIGGLKEFPEYIFQSTILVVTITGISFLASINRLNRPSNLYWITVVFLSLFLMLPLSKGIWDHLPLLQRIQFPWRFNLLISIATPAIVAASLSVERDNIGKVKPNIHLAIAVLLPVLVFAASSTIQKLSVKTVQQSDRLTISRTLSHRIGAPEYLPIWVPDPLAINFDDVKSNSGIIRLHDDHRNDSVAVVENEPRRIELDVRRSHSGKITVGQYYYPGWTATLQDSERTLPVGASEDGFLQIVIPPGSHKVVIKLEPDLEERLGAGISFVSLVFCLFFFVLKADAFSRLLLIQLPRRPF